jgi:hypothetical protein
MAGAERSMRSKGWTLEGDAMAESKKSVAVSFRIKSSASGLGLRLVFRPPAADAFQ